MSAGPHLRWKDGPEPRRVKWGPQEAKEVALPLAYLNADFPTGCPHEETVIPENLAATPGITWSYHSRKFSILF
jgi:hypothetical protein